MNSMRSLALSVVRAAVTTSPEGMAHDVFEVRRAVEGGEPPAAPLDAAAIRAAFARELEVALPVKRPKPR